MPPAAASGMIPAGLAPGQDDAGNDPFGQLTAALLKFRDERDWRQFHSLRNLITSVNLEAAELLELTQWKSDAEIDALAHSPATAEALRDECADILMYLLLIADRAQFDLLAAAQDKLRKNAAKYPVDRARGSCEKYTAWQNDANDPETPP